MGGRYRTLTSEINQTADIAKPRQPRTVRVLPVTDYYGRRTRYYLNNWPLPVPAWVRHLDGWTVRGVTVLAAAFLAGVAAGVVALLRLAGRAQ